VRIRNGEVERERLDVAEPGEGDVGEASGARPFPPASFQLGLCA
jgi:hypothetical protein